MPHFCSSTSRRTQPPNGGHTPRTKVSLNNAQHARSRRHTRGHDVPKCPEYPLRAARKPVSILAFLALHLTLQPSNNTDRPLEHWQRVINQAFDQAKEQVQLSLKSLQYGTLHIAHAHFLFLITNSGRSCPVSPTTNGASH
jgi:hypothetical protein